MVVNEERQLRNIDKLDYMSNCLKEDNIQTNQSLHKAETIRDQSKSEMQQFQTANTRELEDLANQIHEMEALMSASSSQQKAVESENVKLQNTIEVGRKTDTNTNQALLNKILQKDKDFTSLQGQMQAIAGLRMQHLKEYNQECEVQSKQTKETENMLKLKENQRY